jgi:anti-sigma factor RsiW
MKIKKTMACGDVKALLSQYQDNELAPVIRERIEAHIQVCEFCQQELLELQGLTARVKQLPEVETGPYFTARVMGGVIEKEKEMKRARWLAWLPLPSSPSMARALYSIVFIVFLVLGILVNSSWIVDLNSETRQNQQQETMMVNLLVESQGLSLINVQDKTFALLVNGNGEGQ